MSISETKKAQKYASIAEVAAAQSKIYADKLESAPDYAEQAKEFADKAGVSASSANSAAIAAGESAASANNDAISAAQSASTAEGAAEAVFNSSLHVPTGEALTALPGASGRALSFPVFDDDGDASVKPLSEIAVLDSEGKIPVSMIPAVALSDIFVVNSQASMLALDAQEGDIAKRTDLGYSLCLSASPATDLSNWVQLNDDILSQLGLPSGATEVGAKDGNGNNTTVQGALDSKASLSSLSDSTGAEKIGYGDVTAAERLSYVVYITGADPTGSTSAVSAIQASIDANKGKKIVLPAGDYLIDDTIFIPRNTQLCGVAPIPTMYHDMVHNNAIVDLVADPGYTKLHLKGVPTKRILTDVVQGSDDPAYSMGIVFAESGAVLDNIAVIGWRKRTDGTYEPPSLTAPNDAGAVPCFDIPVFNASVMSVRMHDTMIAGYIPEGSACYWIDGSRGEQRNGSGNDFNVNDRIKSVGPNDSRQIDCCFWWFHPTVPSTSDARNYYGVMLRGHDDDIRNLTRYPSASSSDTSGALNWIWGGPGTSDHKFRGSVIKGVYFDCTVNSYVGDDRLNFYKSSVVGGANGYPGPWQNLTGAGGKISFNDCVIRQGDIYLKRVAQVWFANTYGESGYFYMTNVTGYVTISDGFIGQSAQDVTINNPDGTTPTAYARLQSPLFKCINSGNPDRFGLFHTSGANNYVRPNIDNAVSSGFDDGTTIKRWSVVHTAELRTNKLTSNTTQNYIESTRSFKFSGYATSAYPTVTTLNNAVIFDTTTNKLKLWNGTAWETIQSS